MTTYILLRDNKESNPLTLPDLKKTGLKPTDLVWVEGQSVCWLSPGQIKELKDLVNGTTPVEETATPKPGAEINHNQEQKHIYVALPKTAPAEEYVIPEPVFEATTTPPFFAEEKITPETKYAKPLDEIKEIYLENLKKRNRNWYENIPPPVRKIAFYALLIITGLVAGLLINNSGNNKGNNNTTDIASQTESSASGIIPASNEQYHTDTTQVPVFEEAFPTETPIDPLPQNNLSQKTLKANGVVETNPIITGNEGPISPITEPVLPKEEIVTEEKEERKKPSIKEIYSQVAVKSNDYTVGSFGGIKNLELTVSNHSRFALDEVEVQIMYLKPMDELLKSETISVRSIPAGGKKTIPVKKTSRGVKVKIKVVGVESKEFMMNTAGI